MEPMDKKRIMHLLEQAKNVGMTNQTFRLMHHLSRKGTKSETLTGMTTYCDGLRGVLEIENQRVGYRLDFVLRGYAEFQEFNFPSSKKLDVLNALAEAAWLGIPPVNP
jgi:hypothetical protein